MLEIKHLEKRYEKNGRPALEDISLTIEKGEFITILGLSGAGKSTLIRCINRLIDPSSGTIEYNGTQILELNGRGLRAYRRSIGMIFQSFNLIDRLSTLTNVLVGRLGYNSPLTASFFQFSQAEKTEAYQALERVGLKEMADRRVSNLSGGQRQRVAIARALLQHPDLILGDEPVASLDPITAKSIMKLLKEINEEDKITMMINLHDVELAKKFATRIIGIANGHVVFNGPPDELREEDLLKIYGSG